MLGDFVPLKPLRAVNQTRRIQINSILSVFHMMSRFVTQQFGTISHENLSSHRETGMKGFPVKVAQNTHPLSLISSRLSRVCGLCR